MKHLSCSCCRFLAIVALTVLTVGYNFLGAYLFKVVQDSKAVNPEHQSIVQEVEYMKNTTVAYILDVVGLATEMPEFKPDVISSSIRSYIDELGDQLLQSYKQNSGHLVALQKDFTFTESLFFSFSMLTTIGSGQSDLILRTDTAKGILFPYAIVGIPLTLVWLMMLGTSFTHLIILIYNRICCFCCNRRKSYTSTKSEDDDEPGCCATTELDNIGVPFLILVILLILWIILGILGLVFCSDDNELTSWGYLDAAMYVFKTLTTIGSSSRQPQFPSVDSSPDLINFILYILYIWFGLILVAAFVRIVFLVIERFFRQKDHDVDEVTY